MFPEMIRTLSGEDLEHLEGKVAWVASLSRVLAVPLAPPSAGHSHCFSPRQSPLWCLLPLCCCLVTSSPSPNLDNASHCCWLFPGGSAQWAERIDGCRPSPHLGHLSLWSLCLEGQNYSERRGNWPASDASVSQGLCQ